jgi:hypothetical protein
MRCSCEQFPHSCGEVASSFGEVAGSFDAAESARKVAAHIRASIGKRVRIRRIGARARVMVFIRALWPFDLIVYNSLLFWFAV